jgi:hypothetical protein
VPLAGCGRGFDIEADIHAPSLRARRPNGRRLALLDATVRKLFSRWFSSFDRFGKPHYSRHAPCSQPCWHRCPNQGTMPHQSINLYFHCMIRHETFRDPKTRLALAGAGMRDSFHFAFFSPSRNSDSFGKSVGSLHSRHPVLQFHSDPGLSLKPSPTGGSL